MGGVRVGWAGTAVVTEFRRFSGGRAGDTTAGMTTLWVIYSARVLNLGWV